MGLPNKLQIRCAKCKVANWCPAKGASPINLGSGKPVYCRLIGGYGQVPVPEHKMSDKTKEIAKDQGACLTIVEVPRIDESSGKLYFETILIWSQPQLHPRQTTTTAMDRALGPSSYKRQGPSRY